MAARQASPTKDSKAERKLAKMRREFQAAREEYAVAQERGKQKVEKARLRADRLVAKSARRLERRAQTLSRIEARLLSSPAARETVLADANGSAMHASPEAAAETIQNLQTETGDQSPVVSPEQF